MDTLLRNRLKVDVLVEYGEGKTLSSNKDRYTVDNVLAKVKAFLAE